MYETKPVLQKLRVTLVGSGAMLLTSSVLLFGLIKAGSDEYGLYGRATIKPSSSSSQPVSIQQTPPVPGLPMDAYSRFHGPPSSAGDEADA